MILFVHCQLDQSSRWVTTGAKTIVPNPEPHVEIPGRNKNIKEELLLEVFTHGKSDISKMKVTNLTGDKGALFLEPVANGSDGGDIHEPETETTHDPIGDLWRESFNKMVKNAELTINT